jgi:hypothetical protein
MPKRRLGYSTTCPGAISAQASQRIGRKPYLHQQNNIHICHDIHLTKSVAFSMCVERQYRMQVLQYSFLLKFHELSRFKVKWSSAFLRSTAPRMSWWTEIPIHELKIVARKTSIIWYAFVAQGKQFLVSANMPLHQQGTYHSMDYCFTDLSRLT